MIEVLLLGDDGYRLVNGYMRVEPMTSPTLPAVKMNLAKVFAFPLEPGEEIEMVKESPPPCPYGRKRGSK